MQLVKGDYIHFHKIKSNLYIHSDDNPEHGFKLLESNSLIQGYQYLYITNIEFLIKNINVRYNKLRRSKIILLEKSNIIFNNGYTLFKIEL